MSQSLQYPSEDLVRLGTGHEHALVDHPRRNPTRAQLQRDARLLLDSCQVAVVCQGLEDLALVEARFRAFLHKHPLITYVAAVRPVGAKQTHVQSVEHVSVTRQFGQHQRAAGVGHLVQRPRVRQPGLFEQRPTSLGELRAVTALELGARDALRRILGVQIEWPPFDTRAKLALEPRRPLQADVAEGSYVVAPDGDLRRAVACLHHRFRLAPRG
jgi:hypothetical protein